MQAFFPKSPPSLGAQAKTRCGGFLFLSTGAKLLQRLDSWYVNTPKEVQVSCASVRTPTLPAPSLSPPGRFCKHRLSEPSLSGQHRALFHPLTVFPISLFKYRQLCMGMLLLTMKPVISTTKFPPHPAPPIPGDASIYQIPVMRAQEAILC